MIQSESYECKVSDSSGESQWSKSKSIESMQSKSIESMPSKLPFDSAKSKLDVDNPKQITVKLTGQEMERFRQSFTNSELRKFMRASNDDKLEQRKLKDQVKSLSEGIRRLKKTKEMERVEELAAGISGKKENKLRAAEMTNKKLREKVKSLEKTSSAEKREHEKRAQEMNEQLEAMREKVANLMTSANQTERLHAVAEVKMEKEFESKLEEKERSWIQRLVESKNVYRRNLSKCKEKAKLRLAKAQKERDEAKKTVRKLGNEKNELEFQVEASIFQKRTNFPVSI